jgi:hypothetical protein
MLSLVILTFSIIKINLIDSIWFWLIQLLIIPLSLFIYWIIIDERIKKKYLAAWEKDFRKSYPKIKIPMNLLSLESEPKKLIYFIEFILVGIGTYIIFNELSELNKYIKSILLLTLISAQIVWIIILNGNSINPFALNNNSK